MFRKKTASTPLPAHKDHNESEYQAKKIADQQRFNAAYSFSNDPYNGTPEQVLVRAIMQYS